MRAAKPAAPGRALVRTADDDEPAARREAEAEAAAAGGRLRRLRWSTMLFCPEYILE